MSTIEKAAARLAALKSSQPRSAVQSGGGVRANTLHGEYVAPVRDDVVASEPAVDQQHKINNFAYVDTVQIDLKALQSAGFLTPDAGRSQLAQEFRRIKRPLLLSVLKSRMEHSGAKFPNLMMVTSALPGEGKTYTSVNLAMSLASELDTQVLLVDGDVAKGDVSRLLGVDTRIGFAEALVHPSRTEELLLGTNVDGLSLLPSGTFTDNLDELYASERMVDVLRILTSRNEDRIVLFDAPPLLATTEAMVLAHHMEHIVLVVEANRTPKEAVSLAAEKLQGCRNVSFLLNKTNQSEGYGYGYGYGFSGSSGAEAPEPEAAAQG